MKDSLSIKVWRLVDATANGRFAITALLILLLGLLVTVVALQWLRTT